MRRVNNIFGEGVSPRLRMIREGLALIGIPQDLVLRHNCPRPDLRGSLGGQCIRVLAWRGRRTGVCVFSGKA